jgi:hypothetical protein
MLYKKINKYLKEKMIQHNINSSLSSCRRQGLPLNGKTVLFWHNGGMVLLLEIEVYYALAMQLRGYTPHFVLCDGTAMACHVRTYQKNNYIVSWCKNCPDCFHSHKNIVKKFGFSYVTIGELLENENLDAIYDEMPDNPLGVRGFIFRKINLAENLISALIRYIMHGDFSVLSPRIIKEYAFDAALNYLAMNKALQQIKPFSVFMSHCTFSDFGPACKATLDKGTQVFSYQSSHKANSYSFYSFSKDSLGIGPSLSREVWNKIKSDPWDERYSTIINQFFNERYEMTSVFGDMSSFTFRVHNSRNALMTHHNIPGNKPIFVFISQVRWDISADYTGLLFDTYDEYILATVKAMEGNSNVTWLIKAHPAEKKALPISRTEDFVRKHYPDLPEHIIIIPYDTPFSPVDFFNVVDGAITAAGTSGLEIASMGKPVITAARYLYTNRGFTYDAQDVEQFLHLVGRAEMLPALSEEQKKLAQKYLVTYLYRQAIPIASMFPADLSSFSGRKIFQQLLPGKNKYIDLIMNSFENKTSPLLPFEWL